MGQSWTGKPQDSTSNWQGLIQNYTQGLPSILNATSAGQTGADLAAAKSAAAVAPVMNQTTLNQLKTYAPQLSQIGSQIQDQTQKSGAQTQTDILQQQGVPQAQAYRAADQAGNPEFYKTLGTATGKANDLMNSINLNGLSAGERSEVERSLGQSQTATGNLGLDNATNAVSNAMNYGSALQAKRTALGNAIGTATGVMSQAKTGFNPMNVMANAGTTNMGTNSLTTSPQSSNQAWNMSQSALGNATGLTQTSMGQMYDAAKRSSGMGISESIGNQIGNICCFIFLEAYRGNMPWWVRVCRSHFYNVDPNVAKGYRRMARWLVPLMRRSALVRFAVSRWMVEPITMFGGYLCVVPGYEDCQRFEAYKNFWFAVWRKLGSSSN